MHLNFKYAVICNLGVFFPYIPREQRLKHSRVASLLDRFVKQRRRGTTPCRTKHCRSSAGNLLCRCQVAEPWPYPDGWTFEAACPWRASSRHAAPLHTFCGLSEESSTSSDVLHVLQTATTAECPRELGPENMQNMQYMLIYATYATYVNVYLICINN